MVTARKSNLECDASRARQGQTASNPMSARRTLPDCSHRIYRTTSNNRRNLWTNDASASPRRFYLIAAKQKSPPRTMPPRPHQ